MNQTRKVGKFLLLCIRTEQVNQAKVYNVKDRYQTHIQWHTLMVNIFI